jgi:predicted ATPase
MQRFHTLAVSGGVPIFTGANKSSAYRFVTLIDIMYEHRWVWVCAWAQVCACVAHDALGRITAPWVSR